MRSQTTLIRDSFELVAETPHAIVQLFYGRLFELDPSLRGMFKTDIKVQATKLVDTLKAVVDLVEQPEALLPTLHELGRQHMIYGVQPAHYDSVRMALLWALGQALQGDFDKETRAAWDGVLIWISREMIGAGQSTNGDNKS